MMDLGSKSGPPKGAVVQEDLGHPQQRNGLPSTTDLDRARDYLDTTSPDLARADWVRVLMALKNTFGDSGEMLARGWSAASDKFNPRDFRDTWQSLSYDGSVGLGTIAHYSSHQPKPRPVTPKWSGTRDYAKALWKRAECGEVASHPYAVKKRIDYDYGARRVIANGTVIGDKADCIVIPMRKGDELTGVECINAAGEKQTFGNKGLMLWGHPEGATEIHVCEGWATCFALSQIFPDNFAGAVTFGCGEQMSKAAQMLADTYGANVLAHKEGEDNVDAWDYWDAGRADEYRAMVKDRG